MSLTAGNAALAGTGGSLTLDAGLGGTTGTAGSVTITGGQGGSTSGAGGTATLRGGSSTDGNGGAVVVSGRSAATNTATNRNGGAVAISSGASVVGGTAGAISVTAGAGGVTGVAGTVTVTGGAGGSTSGAGGATTVAAGSATAGASAGGALALSSGNGTTTGAGGALTITGGNGGANGNGGTITITAGDAGASAGIGGNLVLESGSAAASASVGFVVAQTPTAAVVDQTNIIMQLQNNGAGTGGGEDVSLYSGVNAPAHTALTGSLFFRDSGTGSSSGLYVNLSNAGSGTTWSQVVTASTSTTRNFFQATVAVQVDPGDTITAADLTGGVIAVKPSAGFNFDRDAEIYLNGILLMNGAANEVSSGTGNGIAVSASAPTFMIGDVLTIIYYTNSTNNTA